MQGLDRNLGCGNRLHLQLLRGSRQRGGTHPTHRCDNNHDPLSATTTQKRPQLVTLLIMSPVPTPTMTRTDRRTQILAAALKSFVHEGFHRTSTDTIEERVGVTKPVLYRNFPSKLELYLAIVDSQTDELVNLVKTALDTPVEHQRERVRAAFAAYFNYIEAKGESFRLIFESDMTADPALRERVERSKIGRASCRERE